MYLLDTTTKTFPEKLNILVGGKVNLRVDVSTRVRLNADKAEELKKAFERIPAVKVGDVYKINVDQIYITFLQMKAQAIPRALFEVQPDVQTAVAKSPELAAEVRKQITEAAKITPLVVEDVQITNYDWPKSITEAQEELVKIQLKEAAATAQVRADLQQAKGQLAVEEAKRLVELKKAEAVAQSIDIIKKKLAGAPEYLMWHQIRVMGEAANGPNNAFILYPYSTDVNQVKAMMGNAHLSQILQANKEQKEEKEKKASAVNIVKQK